MQTEHQSLLMQTAHLLLQESDTDTLCQSVFDLLRGPLQLDVYFHYLMSEDRTHLTLASSGGNDHVRAALGTDLQIGQAVCGKVAETCEWKYVTSVQTRTDEMTGLIRSYGVRCYTCQPIMVNGEIAGTLSFGSCSRDRFNAEELDLLRLVAQQVAVVTERKQQSEHMRHLEQLATAGRMSTTLAHEINNPLETIGNLVFLLRDEVESTEGHEYLDEMQRQLRHLTEITQRTLDLFRGKKSKPALVDMGALVDDLVANTRTPRDVSLRAETAPGICVRLIAGELRQVLFNLVTNAVQFSPPDSTVRVIVWAEGDQAVARIIDEGPGISAETRAKLFTPFYSTRGNGGTGIGLWISREMIQGAGGSLTFESDPLTRPGTEFIVRLPLATAGTLGSSPRQEQRKNGPAPISIV